MLNVLPVSLEMQVGLQHKMVSMSHVATVVCPSYTDHVDDACAFYVSCSFYASCACLSCSFSSSAFSSVTV